MRHGFLLGFNTTALVSQPERRSLRIGDYRVVYTIDNGELVIWGVLGVCRDALPC
ncbi:hypothetical protein [Streptomyces sp. NPDC002044]|uniref:type II toxin-antitoxin system RelE family toxin n=1 Tax=Streptomyces sp. NPDC002044 TaxID=3154662 RepID=UPI003323C6FD